MLVTGEAGSGKTRLLEEAAALPGRRWWSVRGYEPESVAPMAACAGLLRDLHVELATLDEDVVRRFEAAHRRLAAITEPVGLVVDDVQWLDSTSAALLHYLVRAHAGDVLVVAAGRPQMETARWFDALSGLLGKASCAIDLRPLDAAAAVALVRSLDPAVSQAAAEDYHQAAGGSPFWLRLLVQDSTRTASHAIVRGRLEACPPDAAALARLLAVAARPVPAEAAAGLLGWSSDRLATATAALTTRGLVALRHGELAITHDLVAEALVADLPEQVRKSEHRHAAQWLEQGHDVGSLVAALQHRAAAGDPLAPLLTRLIAAPQRRLLDGAAVTALAEHADAPDVRNDGSVLAGLARLADDVGEPANALTLWTRAAEVSAHPAGALLGAARSAFAGGDVNAAHHLIATARDAAPDEAVTVSLDVLTASVLCWGEDRFDEASVVAHRALAEARRIGARPLLVEALTAATDDALVRGDIQAVVALSEEMSALARGDVELEHTVTVYRLLALRLTEQYAAAEQLAVLHRRSALETGRPAHHLELTVHLLEALVEQARLVEALEVVQQTEPLLERSKGLAQRFSVGIDLAAVQVAVLHVHALTGDWRAAVAGIVAAGEAATPHIGVLDQRVAASLLTRLGGPAEAVMAAQICEQALATAVAVGCHRCLPETRLEVAILMASLGDVGGARRVLDATTLVKASDLQSRWHRWATCVIDRDIDGLVALRAGYTATGSHLDALRVGLDLARLLEPTAAVDLMQQLLLDSDSHGTSTASAALRQRLRALGARPWRRGPASQVALSQREREIALLMASGASNPQIAAQLFLSRKTVEHHASAVLAKLGARNRTQVAALLRNG